MAPSRDRFISPVSDGQGSYERASRSTLTYRLGVGPLPSPQLHFSYHFKCMTWVPGHNNVPGNDTYLFWHNDGSLCHTSIYGG